MGKNNKNSFIPPKGRPSGSGREGSGLKDAFAVNDLETDNRLADAYTKGEDDPADNVYLRHPNRNTDKGREEQGDDK
ncbi:hypothetical protein [Pedobacter sp.]|uniref:hypothetical protein n=1 Tax=Pedobacter sp. TaxID=1411316 RepID=UPI003D7F2AC8